MTTRLKEYIYEINSPGIHSLDFPAFTQRIEGSCPPGVSCTLNCWDSDDLLCIRSSVLTQTPTAIQASSSRETVILTFMLDGKMEGALAGSPHKTQLVAGEHNIYRSTGEEQAFMLKPGRSGVRMLSMQIPLDDFRQVLHPDYDSHQTLMGKLGRKQSGFLMDESLPVLPALAQLLGNVEKPPADPALQYLFFKSRSLEMLMLQLEQLEQSFCQQFGDNCEIAHMKPLLQARQILEENLLNPPRIKDLAKMSGTNEYDLKRSFKEIWGFTVFGYVTELRMQKAYNYLEKEGKTVGETALLVGYKNPQHFTVAFKKRFNTLPSAISRNNPK